MDVVQTPTAGNLLRAARRGARLTQAELAERAGVAQSVISAYESDRRDPALFTLLRLISATGHHVTMQLDRLPTAEIGLPDSPLGRRLRRNRKAIRTCAERRGAHNVRVFGSVARGEDRSQSDIDLLVDVRPGTGLFALGQLEYELEEILGVPVDLVTFDSLRPDVRAEAEREAILL